MRLFLPQVKDRKVVAVDIGASAVKVVEVERTPEGPAVLRRGWKAFPSFCDLEMEGDSARMAASTIKQALLDAGIREGEVISALPRHLTTVRSIRLPSAPPDQISEMLSFEAQQYVPFPLSEVYLANEVLSTGSSSEMAEVLLVAARRSLAERYRSVFSEAGLDLKQLGINAFGLWALGGVSSRESREEVSLLIDIGAATTDLAVLAGGKPLFVRSLPFGGESLTEAIRLDWGETREGAEALKQNRGLVLLKDSGMSRMQRYVERLSGEVKRSLLAFATERGMSVESAFLCGGGACLEGIPQYLAGALDLPVSLLSDGRLLAAGDPLAPRFATAAGMAVGAIESRWPAIDFAASPEKNRKESVKRLPAPYRWAAVGVVVAGVFAALLLPAQIDERMALNRQFKEAKKMVELHTQSLEKLRTQKSELEAQILMLESGLKGQSPWLDIFKEVNDRFPKGVWLEEVAMERGKPITLRGLSSEDGAVSDLITTLGNSPLLSDVRLGYLSRAQEAGKQRYRFLVTCTYGQTPPVERFVKQP